MKERPILFSAPMVRSLLAGKKTQTRRIVKLPKWSTGDWADFETDGETAEVICANTGCMATTPCPYGKAGDRLWVKETWAKGANPDRVYYRASEGIPPTMRWQSSLFMPRVASRINLSVQAIRLERVESCSTEDAKAEGFESFAKFIDFFYSLNPKALRLNPWVWVVEFSTC